MKKESEKVERTETEDEKRVEEAMLVIVENQLKENNPADTRVTLDRLMAMGESRKNALQYIAIVLSDEVFEMMKDNVVFNEQRYIEKLKALPELPEA
ncbi:MAG: hypothetical protein OEY06_12005 [Gammaproteobacteria bacterium]|nr:hypothetical protein [Gammaproteobacteria bacterium]